MPGVGSAPASCATDGCRSDAGRHTRATRVPLSVSGERSMAYDSALHAATRNAKWRNVIAVLSVRYQRQDCGVSAYRKRSGCRVVPVGLVYAEACKASSKPVPHGIRTARTGSSCPGVRSNFVISRGKSTGHRRGLLTGIRNNEAAGRRLIAITVAARPPEPDESRKPAGIRSIATGLQKPPARHRLVHVQPGGD